MARLNTLKLYQSSGSPNSWRVRIFLAEKELDLTLVPVGLAKAEQRSDKDRMVNLRQMVPTLVLENGTVIGGWRDIIGCGAKYCAMTLDSVNSMESEMNRTA
jgi:hypothetical protein